MAIDNNFIIPIKFGLIDEGFALYRCFEVLLNDDALFDVGSKDTVPVTIVIIRINCPFD